MVKILFVLFEYSNIKMPDATVSVSWGTTVRANVHPVLITIDEMVELGFGKSNSTSCH